MIYLIVTFQCPSKMVLSHCLGHSGPASSPVVLTVYLQLHYNENESVCESVRERRANFLLQQFKNGIS